MIGLKAFPAKSDRIDVARIASFGVTYWSELAEMLEEIKNDNFGIETAAVLLNVLQLESRGESQAYNNLP